MLKISIQEHRTCADKRFHQHISRRQMTGNRLYQIKFATGPFQKCALFFALPELLSKPVHLLTEY